MSNERKLHEGFDNFDDKNIESIEKYLEADIPIPKMVGMFVDESGKTDIRVSEESRKIAAKSLLR